MGEGGSTRLSPRDCLLCPSLGVLGDHVLRYVCMVETLLLRLCRVWLFHSVPFSLSDTERWRWGEEKHRKKGRELGRD